MDTRRERPREHAESLRTAGGRYRILSISEDRRDLERLRQPDMVVLVEQRTTRLVRFVERRDNARAAVGFYRTDRRAPRVAPSTLAQALGVSVADLRGPLRIDHPTQRDAVIGLYALPPLPGRSVRRSWTDTPVANQPSIPG